MAVPGALSRWVRAFRPDRLWPYSGSLCRDLHFFGRSLPNESPLFQVWFSQRMASLWRFAAFSLLLLAAPALRAQQLPTPDQARRLLETRPDLVAQLRREIANSGLTPDQIRARLRAAGYPEDLLNAYMGPAPRNPAGGRDSISTTPPSEDVLDAVAALGLVDSVDTSELRGLLRQRAAGTGLRQRAGRDSVFGRDSIMFGDSRDSVDALDSLGTRMVLDSLGRYVPAPRRIPTRLARRPAAPDTGLTVFGLSVFNSTTTQFDPNLAGPVDANYKLGPGDRIVLILTGDAERAFTLDVTREGFIVVPGVGEIPVANLTLGELEDQLYARLGRVYSGLRRGPGATTHFSVNVARLHSNQVYVLGDVDQPGNYRISSAGTALTALYAAGGPTTNGGMRRIEIRRGGKLVDTLDLYDYLLHGEGSHDVRLQSGDVVFVPVHGARVRVYGEIVRPGTYELRRGESLADLVRNAGGFTAEAATRRVQVARILPPNQRDTTDRARVILDVGSAARASDTAPAFPMEPGDVVRVFRVNERVGRRVSVRGDVGTPGDVGYTTGMHLSDAIRLSGGIKPDAYLGQVLVTRLRGSESARVQLRSAFQDSTGRPTDDLPLREDDEIRVFSVTEFRAPEYVAITGAVRHGGRYAYREGMTLRDLVLLAGGLDERASLREAEIARLPRSRDGGRLAVSERVTLDSSYLLVPHDRLRGAPVANGSGPVQAGAVRDVQLEPYDNILILAQPDWERPRRVVVTGEVKSPGTYTLLTKDDRLSDLLQRTGGLTAAAYTDGIVFYRRQQHLGRVGVDLARVLRDSSYRDNLLLQDGDSIHLPTFNGIVEVQGAVNAPRGVAWVPGANLNYYVRSAGGASRIADPGRAYVTQPDGSVESVRTRVMLPDDIPVPRPGSVVFVTERDLTDKTDTVARLAVIAQILGGLVALVAITRHP
jgi:polysaccharide export outer membrane protein